MKNVVLIFLLVSSSKIVSRYDMNVKKTLCSKPYAMMINNVNKNVIIRSATYSFSTPTNLFGNRK